MDFKSFIFALMSDGSPLNRSAMSLDVFSDPSTSSLNAAVKPRGSFVFASSLNAFTDFDRLSRRLSNEPEPVVISSSAFWNFFGMAEKSMASILLWNSFVCLLAFPNPSNSLDSPATASPALETRPPNPDTASPPMVVNALVTLTTAFFTRTSALPTIGMEPSSLPFTARAIPPATPIIVPKFFRLSVISSKLMVAIWLKKPSSAVNPWVMAGEFNALVMAGANCVDTFAMASPTALLTGTSFVSELATASTMPDLVSPFNPSPILVLISIAACDDSIWKMFAMAVAARLAVCGIFSNCC